MAYINKVDVDGSHYLIEPTLYVTPSKTTGTNTYTATLDSFALVSGVAVQAKFSATNSETSSTTTLNINSTGDKNIYYLGSAVGTNWIKEGIIYTLVYNGTQWAVAGEAYDLTHYIWYGVCGTSASTRNKDVSITGIDGPTIGLCIRVKFTYAQTYNGEPKLNLNNTGAIIISGGSQYDWAAGQTVDFIYDGTSWLMLDHNHATTTYWGLTKLSGNADDDTIAATAKSVYDLKTTVNNLLAENDALTFHGILDSTIANDNDTTHEYKNVPVSGYSAGWVYKVAADGTYAGKTCEVGDLVIAITDASSNQSSVNNNHWIVIQSNVDSALFKGSNIFVDEQILIADGTNGKVKASGFTIATSVPVSALFTDELVKQTALSANHEYNLLISAVQSTLINSGDTNEAAYDTNITVNPYTHTITAANFAGNASTATAWASNQTVYVELSTSGTDSILSGGSSSAQVLKVNGTLGIGNGGTGNTTFTNNCLIFATTSNSVQFLTTGQSKHYIDDNGIALNLSALTSGYVLEVGGKTKLNNDMDITGDIAPTATNQYNLGIGGSSAIRWKALFLGTSDSYGDPYTPIYWNSGVPAPVSTIQQASFSLTTANSGVQKIGSSTNVDSDAQVVEIVVTSGHSHLLSTIQWSVTTDALNGNNKQIQLTATVDGTVSGYILFRK